MPNPNPHKARKARKRRSKSGTIKQLTGVLWSAIQRLENALENQAEQEAQNVGDLCRLTHALSQSASTYIRAIEVGELEARVEALEQAQEAQQGYGRRAA